MALEVVDCPVCGSGEHKELFSDHNRRDGIEVEGTYARCLECETVYLRRRPDWKEIVALYPLVNRNIGASRPARGGETAGGDVPLWRRVLRWVRFRPHSWPLEPAPTGGARLLDVGCGNGAKLGEFQRRGYEVWGVDVDPGCVEACRRAFPRGHFMDGELGQVTLPPEFFDCIRLDNCLEHVPDPLAVLQECARILAPGGRILIYVPHADGLFFRLMGRYSISAWIPFHLQLFTSASMRRLLRTAGFADSRMYSFTPNSWVPLSVWQRVGGRPAELGRASALLLFVTCYPLGWAASKFGLGEELVIDVRKSHR